MEARRRNFLFALAVYVVWIIGLGLLASTSGDPPRPRPAQPATL